MYPGMPSRRWCREVLAVRRSVSDLIGKGMSLTDPQIVRLSQRLDRLMLASCTVPADARLVPQRTR